MNSWSEIQSRPSGLATCPISKGRMESIPKRKATQEAGEDSAGVFARLGMGLADWSQKWFPDAFVFALVGLIIVFVAGLFAGVGTRNLIKYFGDGFWGLISFTMQMAMVSIG